MSFKKNWKTFKKAKVNVKKAKLPFQQGKIIISSKTKNTFVVLTDETGKIFIKSSCGLEGFKHALRKTSLAVEIATKNLIKESVDRGCSKFKVSFRGFSLGRNVAMRQIINYSGIDILEFKELTRLPFGGCRPRKMKRN